MELLVVLLAVGLSSSEKLYRGYLPPPGAKHAGGSSGDLQTPLEYPNENPTFGSGERGYEIGETQPQNPDRKSTIHNSLFETGPNNDETFLSITTENPNSYTQTTVYPGNGFDTEATAAPEIVNNADIQHYVTDKKYPMKGVSILQGTESFGNGYHYGKPENMPIISAKGIMNNYKPSEFGMYGGKPIVIKTYPEDSFNNMFVIPNENNYPTNNLYTTDGIGRDSQNYFSTSSNPNYSGTKSTESNINAIETEKSLYKAKETFQKRPQRPQTGIDKNAATLNYKNIIAPEEYSYSFDTSNGIHKDETATTIDGLKASGSYSYTGDDGKVYSVIYTADGNGFQPKGDHLPTPPPIPEAIQKVIEQANIDKVAGIYHDGSYDEEKYGHMKYQGPIERYLQNMEKIPKPSNRNKGKGLRKVNRKPIITVPKESDEYYVNRDNDLQGNRNVFRRPVNNLNGQFGMRKNIAARKNNQRPFDNFQNTKYQSSRKSFKPVFSIEKDKNFNNNIQNKENQSPYFVNNRPVETYNYYQGKNSGKDIHEYKDPGYYYVPPRQIFVEGRLQDIPTDMKTPKEFSNLYEDLKTQSIPTDEYYYVDQRNNNDSPKYQFTNMNSNLTKEGPELNTQTDANSFYDNTNHDIYESNSEVSASKSTNEVITLVTTPIYGNTISTDTYDQENTRNYQEDTVVPERKYEIDDTFRHELDLINLSTTPMPSETKYSNVLSGSINISKGNKTTKYASKYPEGEGYFVTKPDVPISIEDFPSSTYSSDTINEIKTEPIPNIKVDGFGRPIQDSQQFHSTTNFGYTETPFTGRDDGPKPTVTYNFEELASPKDNKTIQFNFSNLKEVTRNKSIEDSDKIGEDFSGPKQPQRYDPTSGYFY